MRVLSFPLRTGITQCIRSFRRVFQNFLCNHAGATIVEFAIVAPVFLTLLLGAMDLGQLVYARSTFNGALEDAARSSTLEEHNLAAGETMIRERVGHIIPSADISFEKRSYYDFLDIERPEGWEDNNANGICDAGEIYTDENGNSVWDADIGKDGNGSAYDVVLYTATLRYDSIFAVPFMPDGFNQREVEASTVVKNQPYSIQERYTANTGVCS